MMDGDGAKYEGGRVRLSVDRDQARSRGSIVRREKGQVSYLRVSSCQEINA